jgi:hypothetical protein
MVKLELQQLHLDPGGTVMSVKSALIIDTEDLDEEVIQKLRAAVDSVLAEASHFTPDPTAVQGWTPAAAAELARRLRVENRPVQAATIAWAAHHGGYAERNVVYALGGYKQSRSLSGYTKPVRRIMRDMIAEGILPVDAANPMDPEYDPANPSFQKAQGFRMPADVAAVFVQALPEPDVDAN